MIQTTHNCRECGSTDIVENGHNQSGNQQYHCKDCGAYPVLDPEPSGYTDAENERILRAYRERGSKRVISRIFGISRNTLTRWLKNRWLKTRGAKPTPSPTDGPPLKTATFSNWTSAGPI